MTVTMKVNKKTSVNAQITADGSNVVFLSASISVDNGSDSITQTIQNKELYQANRADVREQISAFQSEIYELQDEMAAESDEATEA